MGLAVKPGADSLAGEGRSAVDGGRSTGSSLTKLGLNATWSKLFAWFRELSSSSMRSAWRLLSSAPEEVIEAAELEPSSTEETLFARPPSDGFSDKAIKKEKGED